MRGFVRLPLLLELLLYLFVRFSLSLLVDALVFGLAVAQTAHFPPSSSSLLTNTIILERSSSYCKYVEASTKNGSEKKSVRHLSVATRERKKGFALTPSPTEAEETVSVNPCECVHHHREKERLQTAGSGAGPAVQWIGPLRLGSGSSSPLALCVCVKCCGWMGGFNSALLAVVKGSSRTVRAAVPAPGRPAQP